ncbi:MAG: response regulator [SAR202 cluster bacterium]|jgi:CheY-like chemotaxis protein/archaellum biogenesis ATPase FlaH|nr:response regulator [SAR202 cluster bacterium]MDP6511745.1 response regulator [SAR202 cluster bacterium]MDP6714853.1 response regulator [SAR202 cluster bacterium]
MAEKILIVDDERMVQELLVDSLESEGYETVCASDGFEAMRLLNEASPDLVITDVQMPEMDGYKFTQYVRRVSDTPVMIMTGVPQEAMNLREKDVGADSYLIKPISLDELLNRIAALLSRTAASPDTASATADAGVAGFANGPDSVPPAQVALGRAEFDKALQGGIPPASVTLMEGPEESGKSVLCQHIASAALTQGLNVAYYTSLASSEDLTRQMTDLGLNTGAADAADQFNVISLAQLYRRKIEPVKMFTVLSEHMARLFQEGTNFVIFDDLTPAIPDNHIPLMKFFDRSSQLAKLGLTIMASFRSSLSQRRLVGHLRATADAHLSMSVEVQPKGRRMEVFNQLEVKKINNTMPTSNNKVMFRVSRLLMRFENRSLEIVPASEMFP